MIGFRVENDRSYHLSAKRLRAIEKHLQKRVQALLEMPCKDE